MKEFRLFYKYILHFLSARHTQGFGVHSPFIFNFTRFVLCESHSFYIFETLDSLGRSFKKNNRTLNTKDFVTEVDRIGTVAEIAEKYLISKKQCQLLFRIAHYQKVQKVLEIGTSFGIATAYLASSSSQIKCVSLEVCPEIAQLSQDNFIKLGLTNIQLEVGDIDKTLPIVLNKFDQFDLIFIHANQYSEAILKYFEQCLPKAHNDTVLVIAGIYGSVDMEIVWHTIKKHPRVSSTIDLFQMGIVFFNIDLYKTHYKMRF